VQNNPVTEIPETTMTDTAMALKRNICFLLLPEYPLYALVPAIEALRLANQNSGQMLYQWSFASVHGGSVGAGNGFSLNQTLKIESDFCPEFVMVCAGNQPTEFLDRPLLEWLARRAAFGAKLGAIDTGAFALASAGVLTGYKITLHWEARAAFQDMFPQLDVLDQIFVIDRDRWTCAGGSAALDMMLAMIAMDNGPELAEIVTDGFVHGQRRPTLTPQRQGHGAVVGDLWGRAQRLMQGTCLEPMALDAICGRIGTSRRTLERLAIQNVGMSPSEYYLSLRLAAGKEMLMYSAKPVCRIAEALRFPTPGEFTRAFKRSFHMTPLAFRQINQPEWRHRFHPAHGAEFSVH
jgi:AraC family carnitine catabolism transcriptional activator